MKELQARVVGMVWYLEEDFAEAKSMMKDGDKLHRTYAEWKAAAEQGESSMRGQGHLVVRAHLVPAAFRQFCLQHGLEIDAQARNRFASWVAYQAHGKTH